MQISSRFEIVKNLKSNSKPKTMLFLVVQLSHYTFFLQATQFFWSGLWLLKLKNHCRSQVA